MIGAGTAGGSGARGPLLRRLLSCGDLRVTVDGDPLREDGSVVRGAFAAGACASNIATYNKDGASGIQLGESSYFGRRVGLVPRPPIHRR